MEPDVEIYKKGTSLSSKNPGEEREYGNYEQGKSRSLGRNIQNLMCQTLLSTHGSPSNWETSMGGGLGGVEG